MDLPTEIPISEGNDKSTEMEIDLKMEYEHVPKEDTQVDPKIVKIDGENTTKVMVNTSTTNMETNNPTEKRFRKIRGSNDDFIISSNFSKNQANHQTKDQGEEKEQEREYSPSKSPNYQQRESEMMELLSSIIMDETTSSTEEQQQKIQKFIKGIYKDIKPDQRNIQPKKKFTFARLPELQNNEFNLINKYIQALNKMGKASLFQVKRNLKEWLMGVAKYRWNMEDLLEDRTRQLLAPKDQPIQFTTNFRKAIDPTDGNTDISNRYVFTFLNNVYTEEEKIQLQKTCTTQMSKPDSTERRPPNTEEEKAIMGLYGGLFTCRPLPHFVYHILSPINVHRFEEHIAREVEGELMFQLPSTMKIDPQVYHSIRIAADILSEMSKRTCSQETKDMLEQLLKTGKVFSYHPERHSIHVIFDTKQQANLFAGLEVPFKNQVHSLQEVNYEKAQTVAKGGIRK